MSILVMLSILLGIMVAVLVVLLIIRSTLEMHEDDQLFIGASESHMAKEQEELQVKLSKIEPMVKMLSFAVGGLLVAMVGIWLYQGLTKQF